MNRQTERVEGENTEVKRVGKAISDKDRDRLRDTNIG